MTLVTVYLGVVVELVLFSPRASGFLLNGNITTNSPDIHRDRPGATAAPTKASAFLNGSNEHSTKASVPTKVPAIVNLSVPNSAISTVSTNVPVTLYRNSSSTVSSEVCEDSIDTCSQYGRTPCTEKTYEAWAKSHCALYCGFCAPPIPENQLCENKLSNCAEYDSGNLCTDDTFYTWAYDNCKGYCKFDICNDSWCEDSKGANCPLLDSALNMCTDIPKAKTICRKYCNLCNVTDGKWCSWGPWNSCDVTCGNGTQVRTRHCACPKPENGGTDCDGPFENTKTCLTDHRCPVNGGWSTWSGWGSCSVSCGIGLRRRDRHCNNPYPSLSGDHCFGENINYDVCAEDMCSSGNWTSWGEWDACSVTCGVGLRRRERNCTVSSLLLQTCTGDSFENEMCIPSACRVNGGWSTWSDWGSCSVSCGLGLRRRDRHCNNPYPSLSGDHCFGENINYDVCAEDMCSSGNWTSWGEWDACSVTCGVGLRRRERNCTVSSLLLQTCTGDSFENEICTPSACRVNGGWSDWSSWTSCSEYIFTSMKTRTRTCTHPSPSQYGRGCIGNSEDKDICYMNIYQSSVRLVNGTHTYEGRLEVYHNGSWGTVCQDGFSTEEARVVCRMLQLPWTGAYVYRNAHYGKGTRPILLDDVVCSGSEKSLSECSHSSWGTNNCGHSEDVGVSCLPSLHIRLAGGSTSHRGRVEVSFDGSHWGTVCDDAFSNNAAKVVCRMLGYATLHARYNTSVTGGTGPTFLDEVVCTGTEVSLLLCKHNRWGVEDCGHDEDVGVVCA